MKGGICWNFLEAKQVLHANHCAKYAEGYKLGFYYGGQCAAPQVSGCPVSIEWSPCFRSSDRPISYTFVCGAVCGARRLAPAMQTTPPAE